MRGFQPAAVEQQFADGGTVGFLKRAFGMAPKRYPSALDEQRQAQQRAQQQSKQPQEPPPQPSGVGALPRDYLRNPGAVLKRREQEAGLKDGGRVRPRGFVSGPGTQTSDSIPARLSDGEYVLPADTVQAVGVGKLDALRDATHTPASGFSAKQDREFFLADGGLVDDEKRRRNPGLTVIDDPTANAARFAQIPPTIGMQPGKQNSFGDAAAAPAQPSGFQPAAKPTSSGFMPGVRAVFNSSGDEIANLANQGRYGAAAGETARAALAYGPALVDDVVGGAVRAVGPGVMDAGRQLFGLNNAAPAQQSQSAAQQPPASGVPAANSPDLEATQRQSKQALEPATTSAAQPGSQGSQIMPGVYSHGRGQYSDNPPGMGFSPGFTGQTSVQNMAAADALASRDKARSVAAVQQPTAPQAAGFQAPVVRSSLNDWQIRNNLRNAQIGAANSMSDLWNKRFGSREQRTRMSPEMAEYMTLLAADKAALGGQAEMDTATMRENAATQRTGMQEAGANQRSADRLASDSQRLGLDTLAKGFDIRNAQRKESILQRYDAAKTDEERAALAKQFPDVFGKQDGNWKLQVTPATKNMDGSTSEGSVIRYNDRTGQVERVSLDGQQQSAPADKAQRKVGVTYMMPNGQLGRWTEKGWLPVA